MFSENYERIKKMPSLSGFNRGEVVKFSYGSPGTRSKLWARVCRFAQADDCINKFDPMTEEVKSTDFYG